MASPPSSQNWKEKPCSWCNTNLDILYFSNINLPLNCIFNNQLSLYLRAKKRHCHQEFFFNFFLSKVWGISPIFSDFFGPHNAKICPQNIWGLWCTSNTIQAQMTFIRLLQLFPVNLLKSHLWENG